ncbi:hypothetical protein GF361_03175, partial [Candidatus Woesearchaeota archaeon]|nr:hypothetical protein [Candidatus Woesearchaeota archaeon]
QFNARADLVDEDTSQNIEIITTGQGSTTDTVEIIILDDNTAPILSDSIPEDNGFLRQGITDQLISIDAVDDETGIKNASFSYWNCSVNATNSTIYTIELNCVNDTCTAQTDLSEYKEGNQMCFQFKVYNNALESSSLIGTAGFDGTPPNVSLIAPEDNAYGGDSTLFSFIASDNLAPNLNCEWIVDNENIDSIIAENNQITNTTYDTTNISEGTHEWKVRCTDLVGLSSDSETRNIIIDLSPPSIILNSPENNSIIGDDVQIDIDVDDNYELDNVTYSSSLNSSELSEGINLLTVTASDKAGNTAEKTFTIIVDRTPPTVNLISPENNASSDVHVNFVFDIDDNLDKDLNCGLYLDDILAETEEFNTNETVNWTVIIPMDEYEWYIKCSDDAGNSFQTAARNITITDVTGPDILSDIEYVARTEDYLFDVNVTDPSNVSDVEIKFDGGLLNLTEQGSLYSGKIQTDLSYPLGIYNITIRAEDELGNENIFVDEFELVNGYSIHLNLDPSEAEPGQEITASGTALLDDLRDVPEEYITINLPEETVDVLIDIDGSYSYTFEAPGQGTYTITAFIVSAEGINHSASAELEVNSPEKKSNDGSSGSSSGSDFYCGDGQCTKAHNEDCENCPEDCGQCPAVDQGTKSYDIGSAENETDESEPRTPSGVGYATGFFGKIAKNPLAWILFLGIIGTLYLLAFKKPSKKKNNVNWKGYFDKR